MSVKFECPAKLRAVEQLAKLCGYFFRANE
jgi:hypothetical protein